MAKAPLLKFSGWPSKVSFTDYKILHGSVVSWKNITSPHRAHRKVSFLRNTGSKGEFTQRMDIELGTFSRVNTLSDYWREASGLLNSLLVSKCLCN